MSATPDPTPVPDPAPRPRRILVFEALFFFLLVPAGLWVLRGVGGTVPVMPLLILLGTGTYAFFSRRAPGQIGRWLAAPWPPREVWRVTLQFGVATFFLTLYVHYLEPEDGKHRITVILDENTSMLQT